MKNNFLKNKSIEDKQTYNAQRNKFVELLRKSKKDYYSNLDVKPVNDKEKFCESVKSFFRDKTNNFEKSH